MIYLMLQYPNLSRRTDRTYLRDTVQEETSLFLPLDVCIFTN